MPLLRRSLAAAAATAAALVAAPALVRAQSTSAPPPPVLLPEQSIAINPLAIPFGLFSGEYEAALPSPGFTTGIGGTYFTNDGDRDSWVEVKGLYYPNEMPFRGFSIGLSFGVHSARHNTTDCSVFGSACTSGRRSQTSPTLGVLASWDWLIGRQERFRVGLGIGAKRTLKDVGRDDPLEQVYPDGRFVIGLVF